MQDMGGELTSSGLIKILLLNVFGFNSKYSPLATQGESPGGGYSLIWAI